MLPCIVRCEHAAFPKAQTRFRPFTQVVCNFPSVNCMQSTDNKHSISQREKRASTSLFCSRRKRKDATLVASQNRGHNMRAAQVSDISPASNCTYRVRFSLAITALSPFRALHLNMLNALPLPFIL